MRRKNHFRRKPRFEKLESRWMLAGDVDVDVVNGKLKIAGDALDNDITVEAGAQAGEFVVTGNGTTLNNGAVLAGNPLAVTGVTKNISVRMEGGNDTVDFDGSGGVIKVPKSLRFHMGDGGDTVTMSDTNVERHLKIHTGSGNDIGQDLDNVQVGRNLVLSTGDGGDQNGRINQCQVGRDLKIDLGAGADNIDLLMTEVGRNARIKTGADDDKLSIGDSAGPTAGLDVAGRTVVKLGNGSDFDIELYDSHFGDDVLVKTGSGNDDPVDIDACEFDADLTVRMKAGDDTLNEGAIAANTFHGDVLFHGGKGTDTLVSNSPNANFEGKRKVKRF
jgi:hypothetical protein